VGLGWLNNVSGLFLSFPLITRGANLCIDNGDWRFCTGIGHFPLALAYNLHSPPVNGKQGLIPEEMSKTMLVNKKQRNLD
jgi:hypothetical protein